ncbi:MAG TPA: ATP-dependent DNA ligase [Actinopolymorphaceae bacterium]
MLFADLVRTSQAVSATSKRLEKTAHIVRALEAADPDEVGLVVTYLSGELRQRRTGVGYASLRDLPPAADAPSLGVSEVDEIFERISTTSGKGSQAERRRLLSELWGRATAEEQRFIAGLIGGELRQGALDGVMVDAVIKAGGLPAADVRRAVMLAGSVPDVASAILEAEPLDRRSALERFRLTLGRPIRPMLASPAPDLETGLGKAGRPAAVEWKLDGIRVQVHKDGPDVAIFTRTLDDVTPRLPEIVELVGALPAEALVLDGEVIALGDDERPRPFQVTASRVGSRTDVDKLRASVPLRAFFFDLLHIDGRDLIGESGEVRYQALSDAIPETLRAPRIVTDDLRTASEFFDDTITKGHEGVVIKSLEAPYDAGRRGASWIKVKPRHTLDLVVLAVEWGHGRRTGLLSNLHLGARNPTTGGYEMLGKTFKGLTDETLRWQTERLLELEDHRDRWTVYVRPELVVEVAFDGVQTSPRYPAGMALRFARVLRYRTDKSAAEADTIDTVRMIHDAQ